MTLRGRITALAAAAVLVVLLIAGLAILRMHERLLLGTLDEQLGRTADAYLDDLGADPAPDLTAPGDEDSVAQLVQGGQVVATEPVSDRTRRALAVPIADPPPDGRGRVLRVVAEVLPDEGSYRVLSVDLGDGSVLHLGTNLDDVRDSEGALRRALLLSAPLVALALGLLIWWLVGRTLRPVEAIRAQVGAIGGDELDRRVPVPATDDEVGRLARTMNGMLDRLEGAAEQQRRFVADASHELRTPLARMRTELEVDLSHPGEADLARTHASALEEVIELQQLVDDLLHLARHDAGPDRAQHQPIDLDELARAAVASTPVPPGVDLDTAGVRPVRVQGDAASLSRAISNLLDNAVRHARAHVWVEVREEGGRALLEVADDGGGIPPADRQRVFERFTRLDHARTSAAGGAGLGLAIVRTAADSHKGIVRIDDRPGGGARITLDLPAG